MKIDAPLREAFAGRDRLSSLVLVLWCGFAVALCVKAAAFPRPHTTYPCFVAGTECWWADKDMYDFRSAQQEYRYSPTFAVAFSPFAWLPVRVGGAVWSLLSISVFYASLNVMLRDLIGANWTIRQRSVFLLLSLIGSATSLWNAQTNTLIISLIGAGAAAFVRRQWWQAALLLAIPVYIKVWPLAVALLFLACWPLPLLRRFSVCMAGLGVLPFLTKPPRTVLWHLEHWLNALTGPMQARHVYRDAWTIWEVVCPPVNPRMYALLQLTTASLVLAACAWRWWTAVSNRQTATFIVALWGAWQLLFGPGTERSTVCIIVPLLTWGLIESHSRKYRPVLMTAAFALVTVFTFGDFERALVNHVPPVLTAIPVGVLLFAVWLMGFAVQDDRRPNGESVSTIASDVGGATQTRCRAA